MYWKVLIDILRHGEPIGCRKFRGHTNDPLSTAGRQQMNAIRQVFEAANR